MTKIYESDGEEAALSWFDGLEYAVVHGEEIAPEQLDTECESFKNALLVERLRDALLPKLLSGEIRVADAEKLADEAA